MYPSTENAGIHTYWKASLWILWFNTHLFLFIAWIEFRTLWCLIYYRSRLSLHNSSELALSSKLKSFIKIWWKVITDVYRVPVGDVELFIVHVLDFVYVGVIVLF